MALIRLSAKAPEYSQPQKSEDIIDRLTDYSERMFRRRPGAVIEHPKLPLVTIPEYADAFHSNYLEYLEICWGRHYGAVVSPHILWNVVLCELCTLIAEQPNKYRKLFTKSESKIEVSVPGDTILNLSAIIECLRALVPTDSDLFMPKFTTSTQGSLIADRVAFCDMVSPYYSYSMYLCGIPKIRVDGTPQDWEDFQTRLAKLAELLPDASKYLLRVKARIELMSTEDPAFWTKMFRLKECGSGHQATVEGWITEFFRKTPEGIAYVCNFPTCVSLAKYKQLETKQNYKLKTGLFASTLEDEILIPDFYQLIMESDGEE
jgi:hypothetical protein